MRPLFSNTRKAIVKETFSFSRKRLALSKKEMYSSHPSLINQQESAPVAQLDRVPGYEPGGRGFESYPAHHDKPERLKDVRAFLFSTVII